MYTGLFLAFFGPLAMVAPVLAGGLLVGVAVGLPWLSYRSRSGTRARRAWRALAPVATGPDQGGPVVRLEGTVSASERADGVVLGAGDEVWPARFTVTFEGGEAHVEPSALCVSAEDEVRLGDRVELLGPAVRTTCGGGSYRAGRLALLFEGVPERPIFVRKLVC